MRLENIPIYRMTLRPESYLLMDDEDKSIADLICELPNTENKHRKRELGFLPKEEHRKYYNARLLLETKRYCREMLYNCSIGTANHEDVLCGQAIEELFRLISTYRASFFKYLVLNDLASNKLYKGFLEEEVKQAESVDEILKHLRKYGMLSRLVLKLNESYLVLRSVYC